MSRLQIGSKFEVPRAQGQRLRIYFGGMTAPVQNFGDALNSYILHSFGFRLVHPESVSTNVLNPTTCLCCVGSVLHGETIRQIEIPLEIWGSGWKGAEGWDQVETNLEIHAVRGPLTAKGLNLGMNVPMGDSALLLPYLRQPTAGPHGRSLLIQHMCRISSPQAAKRAAVAGCDEVVGSLVHVSLRLDSLRLLRPKGVFTAIWNWRRYVKSRSWSVEHLVDKIAGASFVLTGSLHGAIVAQAFGVPWAAYTDGIVDAPPKWADWGAYLGIDLSFVSTLRDGEDWWAQVGRFGTLRSLWPLLESFPYIDASPTLQQLAQKIKSLQDATCETTNAASVSF